MIRRPPRSTLYSSSAASDVYKRQVEITEALPVEERWTPPKSRRDSVEPLHARAGAEEGSLRSPGQKQAPTRKGRAPARAGTARAGRCEAARALQQRVWAARALSAVHVAALVRVFPVS